MNSDLLAAAAAAGAPMDTNMVENLVKGEQQCHLVGAQGSTQVGGCVVVVVAIGSWLLFECLAASSSSADLAACVSAFFLTSLQQNLTALWAHSLNDSAVALKRR